MGCSVFSFFGWFSNSVCDGLDSELVVERMCTDITWFAPYMTSAWLRLLPDYVDNTLV